MFGMKLEDFNLGDNMKLHNYWVTARYPSE
jgi:hypothetical protein